MTRAHTLLVIGKSGQLARSLSACSIYYPELELHFLGRPDFDIRDFASCRSAVKAICPDLIVNTAAFTDVDAAESHAAEAFDINTIGPGNLARAATEASIPIIHISSDYVFDGKKTSAYVETDPTRPQNTYGHSKLGGEKAVIEANPQHIILRTAWLYSPFSVNFVTKILNAAANSTMLSVVTDQIGNPTSALDLANAILELAPKILATGTFQSSGIYHLAGPSVMSRHELAHLIFTTSARLSGPVCEVGQALSRDYPTPAIRPLRTALNTSLYQENFGFNFPSPEASLAKTVSFLLRQRKGVQ
ncbi:MAG: dTDP-4-dehydrorhamnose reductase [Roseibium sp.]|uniref:dTDP-4-dehydrorhamnose reductase n=1 Tax=Roseibium sp. TaxID=1936156 RepID=UPI002631581B|nr:dTDP-4-dehydrorhamnose reductase [Roseibium sp.]MCV0425419.1 dTDP-4-dehydrorhamnose reductase [Roseibium sp.]